MHSSLVEALDRELAQAVQDYYAHRDAGGAIDTESLLAKHAPVRDRLAEFLAAAERIDRYAGRAAAQSSVGGSWDAPPSHVGDYELGAELGRGGMGVVYRAIHRPTGRPAALKMLRLENQDAPEHLQRFQIEIRAVAALDHSHIVPIDDVGISDGRPWFTMKLLEGGSLAQRLAVYCNDPSAAAGVALAIAGALEVAHARGILHRDVKPHNILLDGEGKPWLTDFGLAKLRHGEFDLTASAAALGSPNYMAPEQARGKSRDVTTAADVYGLGATLYALLTGRPPFAADTLFELLHQIQTAEPVPPRRLQRSVPADLELICLTCLRKERSDRYATAADVAGDLDAFLRGHAIRARAPGRIHRAWQWCRRHRAVAALSLLLVGALASGGATSTWYWWQARSRLVELAAEKERAESSYRLARAALDRNVKLLSDETRSGARSLESLRLEMLGAQLEFHRQFVKQHGGDATFAADLGASYLAMGHLANDLGDQETALAHFQQALKVYEPVAHGSEGLARFGNLVAACWNQIAAIQFDRQRQQDVDASFANAQRILEQVLAGPGGDDETTQYLAETLKNLGNLRRSGGRVDEATELHERAVAAARRSRSAAGTPWATALLATTLNELGYSCERGHRPRDAERAYREGAALFEELVQAHGGHAEWLSQLADSHGNLASVLSWFDLDAAAAQHPQCLAVWERLVRDHPHLSAYRARLAESHGYFGDCLRALERYGDSEAAYLTAFETLDRLPPQDAAGVNSTKIRAYAQYGLGLTLLRLGRLAEADQRLDTAAHTYSELATRFPELAEPLEMHARASEALAEVHEQAGTPSRQQEHLQRAAATRRKLVALGPQNRPSLEALAVVCERLATLLRRSETGDAAAAEQAAAEAAALRAQLAEPPPVADANEPSA